MRSCLLSFALSLAVRNTPAPVWTLQMPLSAEEVQKKNIQPPAPIVVLEPEGKDLLRDLSESSRSSGIHYRQRREVERGREIEMGVLPPSLSHFSTAS